MKRLKKEHLFLKVGQEKTTEVLPSEESTEVREWVKNPEELFTEIVDGLKLQ